MTVFNELWARGNWDTIVHVVTRSYQKTGENTRYPQKGAICPGVSDRERYKIRHTVERFFAHIKEHKRLIAHFDKLDGTFFSFSLSLASMCLKYFVNSAIVFSETVNKSVPHYLFQIDRFRGIITL